MKIKNLLPSVLLLILFSCEKTESDIVKEEFEKYVYENLNLPGITKHPDIDAMVKAIKEGDSQAMLEPMDNVLATVTEEKYSIIKEIKQTMIRNGAIKAMMSGSGPTVVGIFETMVQAATAFDAIKEKGMAREIFISKFVNPQEEK